MQHPSTWNGGVLTTAGNLVFQGRSDGYFAAYAADTGELKWETPVYTGIVAAPVTYAIDGEQYVAVIAGWGGSFTLFTGRTAAQGQMSSPRGACWHSSLAAKPSCRSPTSRT